MNCKCLELTRVGRGVCNTIMGLKFGLIYMNPLASHLSLNVHDNSDCLIISH